MPVAPFAPDVEATFVPAEPPAEGRLARWKRTDRPGADDDRLELILPAGSRGGVRRTPVAARFVPVAEAIPSLVGLSPDAAVTRSAAAWAAAAKLAVDLVARGRLQPGPSPGGMAAWRVGPLDPADHERLAALASSMPAEAHALPLVGTRPLRIRSAASLLQAFLDAVADRFVRTAAAPVVGGGPFTTATSAPLSDDIAAWLAEAVAAPGDRAWPGLRLTLPEGPTGEFRAVVQLRSHLDPSLVIDAADVWDAPDAVLARLGADADTDLLLTLRRAARVWPPLKRLLDETRPEVLVIDDGEVGDLLGPVADDLAADGVTWQPASGPALDNAPFIPDRLAGVVEHDGSLIAVVTASVEDESHTLVWSSADGLMWESLGGDEMFDTTRGPGRVRDVAAFNGWLVVAAEHRQTPSAPPGRLIWISGDGVDWLIPPEEDEGGGAQTADLLVRRCDELLLIGTEAGEEAAASVAVVAWASDDGLRWRRLPSEVGAPRGGTNTQPKGAASDGINVAVMGEEFVDPADVTTLRMNAWWVEFVDG
ncbi:MAG: hypothetical protein ACRD29_22655 [Acidimicrobiales bacterium]